MSTKLTIRVTKDILRRSKHCVAQVGANCAVALAVRDILPNAWVQHDRINPFTSIDELGDVRIDNHYPNIYLPPEVTRFINRFDGITSEDRENMEEIEFDVEIDDKVLEKINIDELKPLLVNHPTLKLDYENERRSEDYEMVS